MGSNELAVGVAVSSQHCGVTVIPIESALDLDPARIVGLSHPVLHAAAEGSDAEVAGLDFETAGLAVE